MYIKRLSQQTILYGIGVFIISLTNFLLLPIYTRYLPLKAYAELSLISAAVFLFQYVFNMGLYSGFMIRYFDSDDNEFKKKLASSILVFYIFFSLFISFILLIFYNQISRLMIGRSDFFILLCVLLIVSFETLLGLPMLIFRITESPLRFIIINFIKGIGIILTVFFVIKYFNGGVIGVVTAQAICAGIVTLLAYAIVRKHYIFYFDIKELWISLKLGFPVFIIMIALWFVDSSNRFIVKHFSSMENLAIYSLGIKLGQLILFFVSIFQTVWQPLMFKIFKDPDSKRIYSDIFTYVALALIMASLAISAFSKELILVFSTAEYLKSVNIIKIITITYVLFGLFCYLQTPLLVNKKLYTVAFISCLGAVLNVLLSYILIPRYDIYGAVNAIFITYLILVVTVFIFAQRTYSVPYDYLRFLKICLSAAIVYLIVSLINVNTVFCAAYKTIALSLFFIFLYLLKFFNKNEIAYIRSFLSKRAF